MTSFPPSSSSAEGPRPIPFQAPQGDLCILAGSANPLLSKAIADRLGVTLCPCKAHLFSEGNVFVQILENVRGRDTFIIQGNHYPVNDNFMELLFWIDALKRASAEHVTAVIPFFSYSKGDKKDEPRVSIRARVCADAIEAAGADRVLTMDLHSPQIQGFFSVPVDHLYGRHVICAHLRSLQIPDLVVCSPDIGFAKDASDFAKLMSVPVVIGNKKRTDHTETVEVLEVIGEVTGKNVILVDDFTITGRTLIAMAEVLKRRGAKDIYAAVTHGVLSQGAASRIQDSVIKQMFVTDTIECGVEPLPEKFQIISVANVFAEAIRSIHERTSVSMLFPGTRV
ncbi:MAG: ribose-phosphate pyrophosphokinase [Planctomycetota bacterium]|nr:ribose-phosphate pyrophosphokinase [Planctomycetota bacterium]MDA1214331.1 ribose-phosphate pyrophosphokinase [Planctomycetota bacterium]